ncbi:MAG: hypothetical protein P8Y93_11265 [Acidobacteriota bacterium]
MLNAALRSMSMENGRDNDAARSDLGPVIVRLREIQRKCGALGTRNEEFPLMEERLGAIVGRLEAGEEAGGEPLRFGDMARQLFPVAHLFESYGFLTVGKEIAHVERTLRDLDPGSSGHEAEDMAPIAAPGGQPLVAEPDAASGPQRASEDLEPTTSSFPLPVAIALLVLLAAVATVTAIIVLRKPVRRDLPPPTPAAAAQPTAIPAAAVEPQPTLPPLLPEQHPAARLAEEIGHARLALEAGDIEAAVDHLSQAALVDVDDGSVIDTAQRIVASLLGAANGAVDRGEWELAEERLARAEGISRRFGLETARIESARRRFAAMERFTILEPSATGAIVAARGRRVEVRMRDGSTRQGRVEGVEGATLLLEVDREVGGGTVSYTDPVPIADIQELKIYEE